MFVMELEISSGGFPTF